MLGIHVFLLSEAQPYNSLVNPTPHPRGNFLKAKVLQKCITHSLSVPLLCSAQLKIRSNFHDFAIHLQFGDPFTIYNPFTILRTIYNFALSLQFYDPFTIFQSVCNFAIC
jgi:hypothetical protein